MKKTSILLCTLLALLLCGCSIQPTVQVRGVQESTGGGEIPGVSSLDVNWVSGTVVVRRGDVSSVTIREESEKPLTEKQKLRWYLEEGELHVEPCASNYKGKLPDKTLTITLPAELHGEELSVETVSAALRGEELQARKMSFQTVSGSITLADLSAEKLELETVSGTVSAALLAVTKVEAEAVSGDITLLLPSETALTARLDTTSGELYADFPLEQTGMTFTCQGSIPVRMELETVSGDIHLKKAAAAASSDPVLPAAGVSAAALRGKWELSDEWNDFMLLKELWGSALKEYGAKLTISGKNSFSYHIGLEGGEGTYLLEGDALTAHVTRYNESGSTVLSLRLVTVTEKDGDVECLLVMDLDGTEIWWEQD